MSSMRWMLIATFVFASAPSATLQIAPVSTSLFASQVPLHLRLEAPLASLFAKRKAPDAEITGTLSYVDGAGHTTVLDDVTVSLRGHTSLDPKECSFPKLKLRFAPGRSLETSIFRSLRSIKIGTHCGEGALTERTPKGRLAHDVAPFREGLAYRLLDAMGVTSLKARAAEITYVDGEISTTHKAMLLEDLGDAMRRLGADREIPKEQFTNGKEMFAAADGVRLALGEAAVGNFDWCVRWTPNDSYRCDARQILWNVAALGRQHGSAVPLIYDFDVAGLVTGGHGWFPQVFSDGFEGSTSRPKVEAIAQTQRLRSLFTRGQLDTARAELVGRKAAVYRVLERAPVDPEGRSIARAYLDGFFDAIETDSAFYRPAVTAANTSAFVNATRTQPACNVAVGVGTPVGEPQTTRGNMVRVSVLDALWRWPMNRRCEAMRRGPVWIAKRAINANYPAR